MKNSLNMMKYIVLVCLFLNASLFATQNNDATKLAIPKHEMKCKKPPQGPPGPPGPPGVLSTSFASAYNSFAQIIDSFAVLPVQFNTDQPNTPRDIVHPVLGDSSQFQVLHTGFYHIGWNFTVPFGEIQNTLSVSLRNVTTGVFFNPTPFQQVTVDNEIIAVSGQIFLFLPAFTTIQLNITASNTSGIPSIIMIQNASFFIFQVAS